MKELRFKKFSYQYKHENQEAFFIKSLHVTSEKLCFIYGENGCGKSTLLRLISQTQDAYGSGECNGFFQYYENKKEKKISSVNYFHHTQILFGETYCQEKKWILSNQKNSCQSEVSHKLEKYFDLQDLETIPFSSLEQSTLEKMKLCLSVMIDKEINVLDDVSNIIDQDQFDELYLLFSEDQKKYKKIYIFSSSRFSKMEADIYVLDSENHKGLIDKSIFLDDLVSKGICVESKKIYLDQRSSNQYSIWDEKDFQFFFCSYIQDEWKRYMRSKSWSQYVYQRFTFSHWENRSLSTLSSGQKTWVQLGLSLCNIDDPIYWINPFMHLDDQRICEIKDIVLDLRDRYKKLHIYDQWLVAGRK